MRPIHLTDLDIVVRALLPMIEEEWSLAMQEIVLKAEIADRYRKRTGRAKPDMGVGTLSSAVAGWKLWPPGPCDVRYRRCMLAVLKALR